VPAANTPYHQLERIPLKYNSSLGQSSVAIPYYEELLYNQMDALNMLYVATTRTKEYLYISTLGKKTEGISTIGDLLIKVFEDSIAEDGRFLEEEPVVKKASASLGEILKPERINLQEYPVSDRLTAVFNTDLKRRELDMLGAPSPGREGSILHEVLARAADPEDISVVLAEMLNEGFFREEELRSLEQQATTVLAHAELQQLLNSSTETVSEKSIIDRDGKSYRPDKVLISDNEVIVIDYKFTQKESPAHIKQVHGYRTLLQEMGYASVSTYLFYANSGELKLV
jgi:ATP-dependent exoDNAse (exonuclease V) beta subunit